MRPVESWQTGAVARHSPGATLSTSARSLAEGEGVLVVVDGDLDFRGAPVLRGALAALLREGRGPVLLELADVGFIDSSGLATLLNTLRRLTGAGRRLVLVAASAPVCRLLIATGLQDSFLFAASVDEAVDAVGPANDRDACLRVGA